jgi:hypothetical protein
MDFNLIHKKNIFTVLDLWIDASVLLVLVLFTGLQYYQLQFQTRPSPSK